MNRGQLIDAVAAATELPRTQVEASITATLRRSGEPWRPGRRFSFLGSARSNRGSAARVPPATPRPGPSCSWPPLGPWDSR